MFGLRVRIGVVLGIPRLRLALSRGLSWTLVCWRSLAPRRAFSGLPSAAQRLHQVDVRGHQVLAAADQRQLGDIEAALGIEHVEKPRVARFVTDRGEPQRLARGLDTGLRSTLRRRVWAHVSQRGHEFAEW